MKRLNKTTENNPILQSTKDAQKNCDKYGFSLWTSRADILKLRIECTKQAISIPDLLNYFIADMLENPEKIGKIREKLENDNPTNGLADY